LSTKQDPSGWRLTGMHAPLRQVLVPVLRAGALIGLAMLLILGLFPAILAAQAGRSQDHMTSRRLGAPDDLAG
jgi:hypothetical protein